MFRVRISIIVRVRDMVRVRISVRVRVIHKLGPTFVTSHMLSVPYP